MRTSSIALAFVLFAACAAPGDAGAPEVPGGTIRVQLDGLAADDLSDSSLATRTGDQAVLTWSTDVMPDDGPGFLLKRYTDGTAGGYSVVASHGDFEDGPNEHFAASIDMVDGYDGPGTYAAALRFDWWSPTASLSDPPTFAVERTGCTAVIDGDTRTGTITCDGAPTATVRWAAGDAAL
jgi:hypothetical protein